MSTQPEALRLADALDAEFVQGRISNSTGRESAVELRRLHDLVCVCGAVWEGEMTVHPPRKREWVGLTDEEILECTIAAERNYAKHMQATRGQQLDQRDQLDWWIARCIEDKLKEKNKW